MKLMKKFLPVILIMIMFITIAATINHHSIDNEVPYPEGFRNWTHIKTGYVGKENPGFNINGGFHHIYANEKQCRVIYQEIFLKIYSCFST